MPSITHLFWNATEARPRAIWRILAQILIALLIIIPLEEVTQALALEHGGMPALLLGNGIFLVGVCGSVWLSGHVLCRRSFAAFGFQLHRGWSGDFGLGLCLGALLRGGGLRRPHEQPSQVRGDDDTGPARVERHTAEG